MNRPLHGVLQSGLLAASLGLLSGCGGADHGPFRGQAAYDHTQAIVDRSPRPPGSEGIREVASYIESELRAIDPSLQLNRQRFTNERAPGIEFENLWVELPGTGDPNGPILAIAAHYDSKITANHPNQEHNFEFVAALDAAGACGTLIELARLLHETPRPMNVWLLWFDGEESLAFEWQDELALFGSQHFVDTMMADKERFPKGLSARMKVLILLDLLGDTNLKIDKDLESNPTLLDLFTETGEEMGIADKLFRYQSPMKDDHIPFKRKSVKVIDLIDFAYRAKSQHNENTPEEAKQYFPWWHTPLDTMEHVSADSLGIVGNLVWRTLPRIEAKYYR